MARAPRDYKREYQQRIAKGLAAGKTRAQARGHGAERKGAVGASKELPLRNLPAEIRKLRGDRSVKVMARLESGRVVEIARGRPAAMLAWFDEKVGEDGDWADFGSYGDDHAVSVQVIFK